MSTYKKVLRFFGLTHADIQSIARGAIIAGLGAAVAYLIEWLSGSHYGVWTPVLTAILSVLVNTGRKSIDGPVLKATGKEI